MRTLNIDSSTVLWFALSRAKELGLTRFSSTEWITDAEISDYPNAKVLWEDHRLDSHDVVVELPDAVISLSRERRTIRTGVYAASPAVVQKWLDRAHAMLPPSERNPNLLDVTFWYYSQHGPRCYDRQLQAPSWKDIEENYPAGTRVRLTGLQSLTINEERSGKLVLWQGEPGTGKTFALRALAEEWASWCRVHYILDPERFFMEGDYLLTVILGADTPVQPVGQKVPEWRLIVLEDAGEMLAKDAKMQVGQGLARLLNLCDGLLGQGLRVLVLITTNEQVGSLHAAVSRPGRCLSQINFEKFDAKSAAEWLEKRGQPAQVIKSATLADLYALSRGEVPAQKAAAGF